MAYGTNKKKSVSKKKSKQNSQIIIGNNPNIGVYKTTKERTTVGGIAEPYKYKTSSIDTTGYSKGKKTFELKTTTGNSDKLGLNKITSKKSNKVGRRDIPKILKQLKSK